MKTYKRICIKDHQIKDEAGHVFELHRGQEYCTSEEKDGKVTVLSTFWVNCPASLFAGAVRFT